MVFLKISVLNTWYQHNMFLSTLQCCIGFGRRQHESATGVHVFPTLSTPLTPPSPYHPSGHPSAPAPSIAYHASHLDWWFITYMILYMFQCHSPKSSHPLPLPQSPKETQMYRTVFFILSYEAHGHWQIWDKYLSCMNRGKKIPQNNSN